MGDITGIVELIGNLGAVGVLAWLVLHVFKVLLPQNRTDRKAATDAFMVQLDKHREDTKQTTTDFLGALATQRTAHCTERAETNKILAELAEEVRATNKLILVHDAHDRPIKVVK